ncbi:MAG: T9SS type A sorting domain-containing protein [Candidatus Cloacimonadota bacterium]|nr:T9SS type A sorting domain-containing protein [Candidatus Cloacimonadota bacterium]
MKKAILVLSLFLITVYIFAQEPEWIWAQNAGGLYDDCGYDLATDSAGNSYVTGEFRNTATFGSIELTSQCYVDVFIAKVDYNGNWLWAICAEGTDSERGYGISIDSAGNSYIIGNFRGTATFGTTSITSIDNNDVFIAKADSDGNWLWARRCGASWGNSIATDNDGACYITGYFGIVSSGDFGTTTLTSLGNYDIFAAKLDTNGNWLWAVQAGSEDEDYAWGISTDNSGNSYITGYFNTAVNSHICYFGEIELLSVSGYDIFVAKLDFNGNWLWAVNEGDDSHDYSYEISTDSNGISFIIGEHLLPSNIGGTNMTYSGTYVASISSSGNWLWAAETNGTAERYGQDVCSDDYGNCYASGYFFGEANFGPYTLNGWNTTTDTFAAKLDSNGDWLWAVHTGGSSFDRGYGIAVDGFGYCYVTGDFSSTFNYGSYSLPSNGGWDIFVAKLGNDTSLENEIIPAKMELSNSPNPFNPSTTIEFSIQNYSKIELTIFNIKGQKIKTLAHNEFAKGSHSILWNGINELGDSVSSGVYLYKLNVNGKTEAVKKCLLLK